MTRQSSAAALPYACAAFSKLGTQRILTL